MEQFSNWLASDPIYMAVAVVLSLIILFGAIKKLFKIVMVAGALLVLWIAYTTWSGEEVSIESCLLYTSPSPRDLSTSRMPSSA